MHGTDAGGGPNKLAPACASSITRCILLGLSSLPMQSPSFTASFLVSVGGGPAGGAIAGTAAVFPSAVTSFDPLPFVLSAPLYAAADVAATADVGCSPSGGSIGAIDDGGGPAGGFISGGGTSVTVFPLLSSRALTLTPPPPPSPLLSSSSSSSGRFFLFLSWWLSFSTGPGAAAVMFNPCTCNICASSGKLRRNTLTNVRSDMQ